LKTGGHSEMDDKLLLLFNRLWMPLSARSRWMILFICAITLFVSSARGQSLSIIKKGESNYWIEATAPANAPQTLQASENLHLWVDIYSDVQEPYSYPFDSTGVSLRYFRLMPSIPPAPQIRVLLLGDSMTADCCGWGRGIYGYFKPNATVVNYAMPWTSTKVFLQSAEWEKMLLIKPDYVLIQYGYIDANIDPDRSTTPEEFADNLRTIVQTIRGFNGIPILVTLHAARLFDDQGKIIPFGQEPNAITKQVAAELKTPLIDLNKLTTALFNELGPSGTTFMHWEGGEADDVMHLSQLGAQYVARLVVNALPDSLGPYLTGILDSPPKP